MLADKDMDAAMASDWKDIQAKYAADEPETPEVETRPAADETKAAKDDTPEVAGETIPVSRAPDGKFKAKASKVDDTTQAAAASTAAPEPQAPLASTGEPQRAERDINRAPSTWKPAARAEFDKLTPALKAEIHRREQDFQAGQAQLLPDAALGKNMRQVIEPYRMMIEGEGGTPERAVSDLLRTAAILRNGTNQAKYGAIAQIANLYGIDLKAFSGQPAQGQQPQPQAQFQDPRVDQLLAHQRQLEQQRVQREQVEMENTVTRWMNESDATGNPKRQYLGDVINEMSALVPQIRQADPTLTHAQALDAAYDRAIWAHPEIRGLLTTKQQTDLEAQRRTDNQARVRDAKRAGSVNVARRASTPSAGKPGTMDETLAATARELGLIA